jgi:hypothetical protein
MQLELVRRGLREQKSQGLLGIRSREQLRHGVLRERLPVSAARPRH